MARGLRLSLNFNQHVLTNVSNGFEMFRTSESLAPELQVCFSWCFLHWQAIGSDQDNGGVPRS